MLPRLGCPVKILCVFGTRPEAIKMAPVIRPATARRWLTEPACAEAGEGARREATAVAPSVRVIPQGPGECVWTAVSACVRRWCCAVCSQPAFGTVLPGFGTAQPRLAKPTTYALLHLTINRGVGIKVLTSLFDGDGQRQLHREQLVARDVRTQSRLYPQ